LSEPRKKRRAWEIDSAVFQVGRKASLFERFVLRPLRYVGKYALMGLAFTYPISLVSVGIIYGGLVFWGFFIVSVALIGLILSRLGYSKNFASWDVSLRKFALLPIAFLMSMGLYVGIIYAKPWIAPIMISALVLVLTYALRKSKI
jgi:hypothetical protein